MRLTCEACGWTLSAYDHEVLYRFADAHECVAPPEAAFERCAAQQPSRPQEDVAAIRRGQNHSLTDPQPVEGR